jgi:predicted CXXCH cytochrome family protein
MKKSYFAGKILPVFLFLDLLALVMIEAVLANEPPVNSYVGEKVCSGCHQQQSQLWKGSHHEMAMQPANKDTVLADFNKASLKHDGVTSYFTKQADDYIVNTVGPDGKAHDYKIKYTFGVYPLQQYLVEFPGGRLQALDIAWDSRPENKGGQRWFRLNPDEHIPAGDVLHWTGPNLNWNYMCAECHSTNLKKNYDSANDRYDTTWSEINVSCEACHGPGSNHVDWAKSENRSATNNGLVTSFNERKGIIWNIDADSAKPVRSIPRNTRTEIEICAVCHSRRSQISENNQTDESLYDNFLPALLSDGLYFADGQINEEVYVYGSFLQSKMNQAGVTCSDCHNPHSAALRAPGEQVCYQCHRPDVYASSRHHYHQEGSAGSSCIECHMPAKTYMEVDPRHDHSFRIPRPDLSVKLGTPNACNNCHSKQTPLWAASKIESWYGKLPVGYQKFATALNAAEKQLPAAQSLITSLAADSGQPAIARATAIRLSGRYSTPATMAILQQQIQSKDPMLRQAALDALGSFGIRERVRLAFPLLDDEVRSVRIHAARLLATIPAGNLPEHQQEIFDSALEEYIETQLFNAERPESQVNLAGLYSDLGRKEEAERRYRKAIELQSKFVPAYVNLAQLFSQQKNEAEAINLLKAGLKQVPDNASLHHALGLALVRQKDLPNALKHLSKAAELAPAEVRYSYVYALGLQSAGNVDKAIELLEASHGLHPGNTDILYALVTINRDIGNIEKARHYVSTLKKLLPDNAVVRQLEQQLNQSDTNN